MCFKEEEIATCSMVLGLEILDWDWGIVQSGGHRHRKGRRNERRYAGNHPKKATAKPQFQTAGQQAGFYRNRQEGAGCPEAKSSGTLWEKEKRTAGDLSQCGN